MRGGIEVSSRFLRSFSVFFIPPISFRRESNSLLRSLFIFSRFLFPSSRRSTSLSRVLTASVSMASAIDFAASLRARTYVPFKFDDFVATVVTISTSASILSWRALPVSRCRRVWLSLREASSLAVVPPFRRLVSAVLRPWSSWLRTLILLLLSPLVGGSVLASCEPAPLWPPLDPRTPRLWGASSFPFHPWEDVVDDIDAVVALNLTEPSESLSSSGESS